MKYHRHYIPEISKLHVNNQSILFQKKKLVPSLLILERYLWLQRNNFVISCQIEVEQFQGAGKTLVISGIQILLYCKPSTHFLERLDFGAHSQPICRLKAAMQSHCGLAMVSRGRIYPTRPYQDSTAHTSKLFIHFLWRGNIEFDTARYEEEECLDYINEYVQTSCMFPRKGMTCANRSLTFSSTPHSARAFCFRPSVYYWREKILLNQIINFNLADLGRHRRILLLTEPETVQIC